MATWAHVQRATTALTHRASANNTRRHHSEIDGFLRVSAKGDGVASRPPQPLKGKHKDLRGPRASSPPFAAPATALGPGQCSGKLLAGNDFLPDKAGPAHNGHLMRNDGRVTQAMGAQEKSHAGATVTRWRQDRRNSLPPQLGQGRRREPQKLPPYVQTGLTPARRSCARRRAPCLARRKPMRRARP